ncbi:MAG TPA: serine hydrolase [Verrucomicrobiae bacterium]|nr:serine hydrolase [Verrucomicrobiae bacterium]
MLIFAVFAAALLSIEAASGQGTDRYTKVANRLVELINTGDYAGIQAKFNKEMDVALPLDQSSAFFKGLTQQMGRIQRLGELQPDGEAMVFPAEFEKGTLDMNIALDSRGLIAGLSFTPHEKTKPEPAKGIEAIWRKHGVPALAVVVTKDGQICDRAAVGVGKLGDLTPVTTNDVFHIGSCTKSMTATLAAMFIEQGKLRWDTTIAEVFPELKGRMDKQYETVTVEQLLHHCGGVPREPPSAAWERAWKEIGTPVEQRREFIEAVLLAPPAVAPGTRVIYSNQGYAIVGAMLEKVSGRDFESLMTEKLFKPLHMDSAGFGPPGTKDKTDQPWGHVHQLSKALPMQTDNPPVISPAGRVHCSLDDLARYAMFHL